MCSALFGGRFRTIDFYPQFKILCTAAYNLGSETSNSLTVRCSCYVQALLSVRKTEPVKNHSLFTNLFYIWAMPQQIPRTSPETVAFPMSSISLTALHPTTQGIPLPKIGTLIPNRIFVGGINSNTTEDELRNFFSVFGPIKDVKVICDKSGLSKGSYGFVTFEDQETAEAIIKNGAETLIFKERKLNIGYAVRKQHILPKQELGSTLLLTHNPCSLSNGLQFFQFCPHDSVITMNPSAVCYPATVMIAPNVGSHELCTILSGAMHNVTQSLQHGTPLVKPGSTTCTTKGLVCPHLANTTRPIPLSCTVVSNRTPGHSVCIPGGTCLASEQCDAKTIIVDGGLHSTGHSGNQSDPKQETCLLESKMRPTLQQMPNGRSSVPSELLGSWLESHNHCSSSHLTKSFPESTCQNVSHNSDSTNHPFCDVLKNTSPASSGVHFTDHHLIGSNTLRAQPMDSIVFACCAGTNHVTTTPIAARSTSFSDRQPLRMNLTGENTRNGTQLLQADCILRSGVSKDSVVGTDLTSTGVGTAGSTSRGQVPNFELKSEPIIFSNVINERQENWPNRNQLLRGKEEYVQKSQTRMDMPNQTGNNTPARSVDHMLRHYQWSIGHGVENPNYRAHNLLTTNTGECIQVGSTLQCPSGSGVTDVCSNRQGQSEPNDRNYNVKTADEHDRCIRKFLVENILSDRSSNMDPPGRTDSERNVVHNNPIQAGRSSNMIPDETPTTYQYSGPNQQFINKSSYTDNARFYYLQPFTPSLTHKGCVSDDGTERSYEDDIRRTDLDDLLFDRKTPGLQVTTNDDQLTKIYASSEEGISRENCTDPFALIQTAELETMSVEKLESTELRGNALATTACGDISKRST